LAALEDLGVTRGEGAAIRPSVFHIGAIDHPAGMNAAGLLGARNLDRRQLADHFLGGCQPPAIRVDLGREVFGVLFVGSA
jgi:hypothetical protein